jgi:UDP-glucose 4-epimerase
VLEAARKAKVARFVYCSSSEIYGNCGPTPLAETSAAQPTTIYGSAKLAGELCARAYLQTYGLPSVILRPFNSYGPREHDQGELAEVVPRFLVRVLNGHPPVIFGTGENSRDFTYVTETAQGLAVAAIAPDVVGETINIAYGRGVSIRDVAATIAHALRRNDLAPIYSDRRPGDVCHLVADTARAERLLGFKARIGFAEGIARYVDWFRFRYPDPAILFEPEVVNWQMPQ